MKRAASTLLLLSLALVAALADEPDDDSIHIATSRALAAKIVKMVRPKYPEEARKAGIEGQVELEVITAKDGTVQSVKALRGHELLIKAATQAVSQWRYKPTILEGQAVETDVHVTINFALIGKVCISPVPRATPGPKSLSNPAGDNRFSSYTIRIDQLPPVKASPDSSVAVSKIPAKGNHLVRIYSDGKLVESFRFTFGQYKTRDLCLWFNSLYETWSLWEANSSRHLCRCKEEVAR